MLVKFVWLASLPAIVAAVPPPPDGLGAWLSDLAYVLAGVWLVMQIVTNAKGKQDWVTHKELDLATTGVTNGSIERAASNASAISALRAEIAARDMDRVARLSGVDTKLDGLTRTMNEGFADIQRALGRLEGSQKQT